MDRLGVAELEEDLEGAAAVPLHLPELLLHLRRVGGGRWGNGWKGEVPNSPIPENGRVRKKGIRDSPSFLNPSL